MGYLARLAFIIGAAALFAGCGGSQPPIGALQSRANIPEKSLSKAFLYTGAEQDFQVPANVKKLTIIARGAGSGPLGGRGGRVFAVVPVTAGETLAVFVGGAPSGINGGFNGGANGGQAYYGNEGQGYGGGGASDVREGGDDVSDRILVAGGGGGQGGSGDYGPGGNGGKGGGSIGGIGFSGGGYGYGCNGSGGAGGTQNSGGAGGAGGHCEYTSNSGVSGMLLNGGSGGDGKPETEFGGYGPAGGGGGGGYYGGGGGGAGTIFSLGSEGGAGGGGGGGSSFIEPSATRFATWQGWKRASRNGLVIFYWR